MAKRGPQELPNGHWRRPRLLWPSFEAHQIGVLKMKFGGIFDEQDALFLGNEFCKNSQGRRFPGPRATADQDIFSRKHVIFEAVSKTLIESSRTNEILHFEMAGVEL